MTLFKICAAIGAFGVALSVVAPADAGTRKHRAGAPRITTQQGSSHAVPGDTCLGAPACNELIAECAGSGLDFKIKGLNNDGEPTYGHCVKARD